jgi:hypothetical protein
VGQDYGFVARRVGRVAFVSRAGRGARRRRFQPRTVDEDLTWPLGRGLGVWHPDWVSDLTFSPALIWAPPFGVTPGARTLRLAGGPGARLYFSEPSMLGGPRFS